MKEYWEIQERQQLELRGLDSHQWKNWIEKFKGLHIIILAGVFGAGKDQLLKHGFNRKKIVEPVKDTSRLSRGPWEIDRYCSLEEITKSKDPRLVTTILGTRPPYEEWNSISLNIPNLPPPTKEEIDRYSSEFAASFRLSSFDEARIKAVEEKRIMLMKLSPQHTLSFCKLFENASITVLELKTNKNQIRQRLIDREMNSSGSIFDPFKVSLRARLYDALTTPEIIMPSGIKHIKLENNNLEDLKDNILQVRKITNDIIKEVKVPKTS